MTDSCPFSLPRLPQDASRQFSVECCAVYGGEGFLPVIRGHDDRHLGVPILDKPRGMFPLLTQDPSRLACDFANHPIQQQERRDGQFGVLALSKKRHNAEFPMNEDRRCRDNFFPYLSWMVPGRPGDGLVVSRPLEDLKLMNLERGG